VGDVETVHPWVTRQDDVDEVAERPGLLGPVDLGELRHGAATDEGRRAAAPGNGLGCAGPEALGEALVSRRDDIVWDIGGVHQPPLPIERMVKESPVTPLDVPMHPRAAAVWRQHGYLP
jgi:hypothetical protein